MKKKINKKTILFRVFLLIITLIIIQLIATSIIDQISIAKLKNTLNSKQIELKKLNAQKKKLQYTLFTLKKKTTIEKIARDDLDMKQKGEVIYKLIKNKK